MGEKIAAPAIASSTTSTVRRPSQIPASQQVIESKVAPSEADPSTYSAIPPPKPPRTDANVLKDLEKKKKEFKESQNIKQEGQQLLPAASSAGIVRSVSDYKSAAIAEQSRAQISTFLRKSRTISFQSTSFELSPDSPADDFSCSGIKCMDEMFKDDEDGFSAFDPSLKSLNGQQSGKAPLVQLQDICSGASIDNESISTVEEEAKVSHQIVEEQGLSTPVTRPIPRTLV